MALELLIEGTDFVNYLRWDSLRIEQQATSFVSTASFELVDEAPLNIAVLEKDSVVIQDGAELYFSGTIANLRESNLAGGEDVKIIRVECQDHNILVEETVIDDLEEYGAERDDVIIDDLFDKYLPEVNSHGPGDAPPGYVEHLRIFSEISFTQMTLREALDRICQQAEGIALEAYWYIDFNKYLHYFNAENDTPAWYLSDTPDGVTSFSYLADVERETLGQIINRVLVVGPDVALFSQDYSSIAYYGKAYEAVVKDNNVFSVDEVLDRGEGLVAKWAWPQEIYYVTTRKSGLRAGMDIRFVNSFYNVDDTFTIRSLTITFPQGDVTYDLELGGQVTKTSLVGARIAADERKRASGKITVGQLPLSSKGWSHSLVFSSADNDTVEWAAGDIELANGLSYSIDAGSTGHMAAVTYIYFDSDTSTTQLQTSVLGPAVGENIITVAVAAPGPVAEDAAFQAFGGNYTSGIGVFITADNIAAGTITGNLIAANTIEAGNIAAGTITANEIAGNTITANEIAGNTITANEIASGTITTTEIAANTITASNIAGDTITADEIHTGTIVVDSGVSFNIGDNILAGWHFDGPLGTSDYQVDLTDVVHGIAPSTETGSIVGVDGKFGKGVSLCGGFTVLNTNPSFETNTTDWATSGTNTIARSIEQVKWGSYSLKCTYQDDRRLAYSAITLTAAAHSLGVWMYIPSDYDGTSLKFLFSSFVGGVGTAEKTADMTKRDQWQFVGVPNYTPDAGDIDGYIYGVYVAGDVPTAGKHVYIDGVNCVQSPYCMPTRDGSMPGCAWTGTAHASTTTVTAADLRYAVADLGLDFTDGSAGTIGFWIKREDWDGQGTEAYAYALYIYATADNYIYFTWHQSLELMRSVWNGNANYDASNMAAELFTDGEYSLYVLIWDFTGGNTDVVHYLDGSAITSYDDSDPMAANPTQIFDGRYSSGLQLNGDMDDFFCLNRAMSAAEVEALYNTNKPFTLGTNVAEVIFTAEGYGKTWANATGFFSQTADGEGVFAVVNTDSITWGSATLDEGDCLIGKYPSSYAWWDQSQERLILQGALAVGEGQTFVFDNVNLFCTYDGALPYNADFTGDYTGHLGQEATVTGGAIFTKGIFNKGLKLDKVTTNLEPNPSFETNTTGWATGGTNTIARSAEQAKWGSYSLKCTYQSDKNLAYYNITLTAAAHSLSAWVWVPSSYDGTTLRLYFDLFSGATGTIYTDVDLNIRDEWQLVEVPNVTPAGGDLSGRLNLYATVAPTAGKYIYLDCVQCEQSEYCTSYCDGSLGTGHSWSGTAHASTSSRTAACIDYNDWAASSVNRQGSLLTWLKFTPGRVTAGEGAFLAYISSSTSNNTNSIYCYVNTSFEITLSINAGIASTAAGSGSISVDDEFLICITWDYVAGEFNLMFYEDDGTKYTGSAPLAATYFEAAALVLGGEYDSDATYSPGAIYDNFIILDYVVSSEEFENYYYANCTPVVQTNKFELLLTEAGKGRVWASADGIFAQDDGGDPTFALVNADSVTWSGESFDVGDVLLGNSAASHANIKYDAGSGILYFRGGTTVEAYVATDGSITWGGGNGYLDSDGMALLSGDWDSGGIRWLDGTDVVADIRAYQIGGLTNYYFRIKCYAESSANAGQISLLAYSSASEATGITCTGTDSGADGKITLLVDNATVGTFDDTRFFSFGYIRATTRIELSDTSHYLYRVGDDLYWYDGASGTQLN